MLTVTFLFFSAAPSADAPPNMLNLRADLAREIVNRFRAELAIAGEIEIALVQYHPLVFSVEPMDPERRRFRLSMEVGFLGILDDDELLGALAHEIGHIWIYTHRPFLQTEQMANTIGQKVAGRSQLERVYKKLWEYERTAGVPMDELLGPRQANVPVVPMTGKGK